VTVTWSGASAATRSSPGSRSIWVTNTIGSSFNPYAEDLVPAPREFAERFFPIIRWAELPRGGHFTAWEEPEAFARELTALAQECGRC